MENREYKIIPLVLAVFVCAFAYAGGPSAPGTGGMGSPGSSDPSLLKWQDLRVSIFSTVANQSKPPSDVKIIGSGSLDRACFMDGVNMPNVPAHDDNAAAIAAGLASGALYRTGDILKVVHD